MPSNSYPSSCPFPLLDLALDVPGGFAEVFDGVLFEVAAPQILKCVAEIESHVLGDLDALDGSPTA